MGGSRSQRQQQAPAPTPDAGVAPAPGTDVGDILAWGLQATFGNAATAAALGLDQAGAQPAGGGAPPAADDPSDADIAWIASLGDAYVREQIDGAFSEDAVRTQVARKTPRKRGQSADDRKAAIEAEVQRRMGESAHANTPKGEAESLSGDAVFEGLDRRAGTLAARKDFVALGVGLLGSASAVQQWFSAIGKADAPGAVYLHESARRRYELARRDFQQEHPGWDFEPSYVAFQTRHRQHARNSTGMLSHLLGLAVDVVANDNPHLVAADERVLIETAGGEDGADGSFQAGRSRLAFAKPGGGVYGMREYNVFRKQIAEIGKATADGKPLTEEQARLVGPALDDAYAGMRGTEARMQGALDTDGNGQGDEVAELRAVAQRYWAARKDIQAARKAVAAAKRTLEKVAPDRARKAVVQDAKEAFDDAKARKVLRLEQEDEQDRLAAEDRGEAPRRAKKITLSNRDVREDPQLAELKDRYDHLRKNPRKIEAAEYEAHPVYRGYVAEVEGAEQRLEGVEGPIVAEKNRLLAPWYEKFDQRIASYDPAVAGGDAGALGSLDRALGSLARARGAKQTDRALEKIRSDPTLSPLLDGLDDADAVKRALSDARTRAAAAKDATANQGVVRHARSRLDDLDWVFGASDGLSVRDPSGLQLAEHGILWQGESAPGHTRGVPSGDEDASETWMREFVRVMMRHGFAPGAEWTTADSMHFELVESMNKFAGKGITYGPKGRDAPQE
ncbi:MAG: hypothetical protein R3F59_33510 [Myxococcota bacterium]